MYENNFDRLLPSSPINYLLLPYRDPAGGYNMVYLSANPATSGFNGHFPLVTAPASQQPEVSAGGGPGTPHHESTPPDAVHGHGENSSVAANWQTATWIASQSGHHHHTSHLLAEHQHQYMNNGFVSPSDAELALNTSGVCTHNVKSPYFFRNTRESFSNKCAKLIKVVVCTYQK